MKSLLDASKVTSWLVFVKTIVRLLGVSLVALLSADGC